MKKTSNYDSLNILLVTDNKEDSKLLRNAIETAQVDHDLHDINNAEKLMDYLSESNVNAPHLIFLDLNMARKKGMECLAEIRANQKFNNTAVAIVSTSSTKTDINNAFFEGANIYIRKPSDFEKLKSIMADTLAINWQYHSAQFNRENFVMVR